VKAGHNVVKANGNGRDIFNVEMVMTNNRGPIPATYEELVEVIRTEKTKTHLLQRPLDHAIDWEPNHKFQHKQK